MQSENLSAIQRHPLLEPISYAALCVDIIPPVKSAKKRSKNMKKMHLPIRLLSLLLAVALLCGLAAPARAVGTGGTRPSFTQVDHRHEL